MRIVEHYSHLNGLEYLMVHKPALWDEIQQHQMPRKFCHSLEDAKKKRCPRDLSSTCIADMCMAWRFVTTHVRDGEGGTKECGESHGFCGLAVDPKKVQK